MKRFFKKRNLKKWIFTFSVLFLVGIVFPTRLFAWAENPDGYPHSYDTGGGSGSGNGNGGSDGSGVETQPTELPSSEPDDQPPADPNEPPAGEPPTTTPGSTVDTEAEEISNELSKLSSEVNITEKEINSVPSAGTDNTNSAEVSETVSAAEKNANEKVENLAGESKKNLSTNVSEENEANSSEAGDPVRISGGAYILQDSDVKNVMRCYTSQNVITGSFGYGWYSNLDEVILVTANDYSVNPKNVYEENYINVLSAQIEEFKKTILSVYGIESLETGKTKLESNLKKLGEIKSKLEKKKLQAEKLLERAEKKHLANNVDKVLTRIDSLLEKCDSEIDSYKNRIENFDNDIDFLQQLKLEYQKAIKKSASYDNAYKENLTAEKENLLSLKLGIPKFYYKVGAGKLVYVDENATPHVFENSGGNKFVPYNHTQNNLISIFVSDSGYELLFKDGQKKIFDKNGLLSKIVDRNENTVSIIRDANGKVVSVKTSFGENYNFIYNGDFISEIVKERNPNFTIKYDYEKSLAGKTYLSSVTDDEGDVVRFSYTNEGRLDGVIKNDGSRIKIDYNEVLENGTIVTTSTTNEEGYSEKFEYNKSSKKTVYTNHDGSVTEYLYDENNCTVWQKNPDGTEKKFSYDTDGNCISEITNGNTVSYSYDDFGNRTRADYSDGSRETWNYDKYSLLIEYVDRDGVSEIFERDEKGNVTKYFKGGKLVLSASYNSKGQMTEQTVYGENASRIFYSYDEFGNLIEKKIGNRTEKYSYDSDDRVKEFFVNGKLFSSYEYDAKKISKIDYNGMKTIYTTDGRKDLVCIEEIDTKTGERRITKIDYDKRHLPIRKSVGNGKTEKVVLERRYTPAGLLEAEIAFDGDENYVGVYSYKGDEMASQARFNVSGKIDFQNADLSSLQKSAKEVSIKRCDKEINDNNRMTFTLTDEIGRTQTAIYDAFGNNVEYQNPRSEKLENKFSATGKLLSSQSSYGGFYDFNYDNEGDLVEMGERGREKISVAYNDDGSVSEITNRYGEKSIYSYNEYGQVRSIVLPGKTEWYLYDSYGRSAGYVLGKTDNIETSERYVLYDYSDDGRKVTVNEGGLYKTVFDLNAFGEIVKRTDGNGNTVEFEYDENGNRTAVTDGYGNTAKFEYNCCGQVTKAVYFDGSETRYYYDSDFNLIKETDALGVVWQGQYDKAGRLIWEKGRPGIDRAYEYDELDRLICVKSHGVVKEMYTYSAYGREVVYTDGNGNDSYFYMDGFGRTVSEKNRVGDAQNYFYDAEGELALKKDFGGGEIRIAYKDGSKIVTRNFSDGTSSVVLYDMSGNVISAVNDSDRTVYQYDKGGRMILAADESGGDVIRYEYDAAGNRRRMTSNSSDLVYEYGKNNELISIADNKQRTSVKFGHDRAGRETSREFGNGVVQKTSYDKAGRVILVAEKNSKGGLIRAEGYVYDSLGRQSAKVSHSGAVTLYEYDGAGHIGKVYYPASKELSDLQKDEAEENGLMTSGVSVGENKYLSAELYSALSALVSNMGGAYGTVTPMQVFNVEEYKYDNSDNLVAKTTPYGKIEYAYDAENRLVSSGSNGRLAVAYTYDANGNLTLRVSALKKAEYAYSSENRMVYSQVVDERKKTVSQVHYRYDAFGRRTVVQDADVAASRTMYDGLTFDAVKVSPVHPNGTYADYVSGAKFSESRESTTNRYFYIDDGQTGSKGTRSGQSDDGYRFVSESMDAERVFISRNGSPVAVTQVSDSADTRAGAWYYGTDIRGSVATATDWYGELKGSYSYDVMGRCLSDGALPEFGYCGKRSGKTTGLYDYGFRDYDAGVGRFTTVDPVRDGANWFGYCAGDAVNWCDLWGLTVLTVGNTKQNDSNEKLGFGEDTINESGCVLTSYYRMAKEMGYNGSLGDANNYAKENNLFSNNDELSIEAGVKLINGLVNDPKRYVVYEASVSGSVDDMAKELMKREESDEKYFVTARVRTSDAKQSEFYDHTLSISGNTSYLRANATEDCLLGFEYNDTSNANRSGTDDYRRINAPKRLDFFKVISKED